MLCTRHPVTLKTHFGDRRYSEFYFLNNSSSSGFQIRESGIESHDSHPNSTIIPDSGWVPAASYFPKLPGLCHSGLWTLESGGLKTPELQNFRTSNFPTNPNFPSGRYRFWSLNIQFPYYSINQGSEGRG